MANLKGRLEKLESTVVTSNTNHCLIVHHEDCAKDRETAIAAYAAEYGTEPNDVINVILISPETKQSVCGCSLP